MPRATLPLFSCYKALFEEWGPQHWWPGRTRAEIVIGAILTQNTAWTNVEKAIRRLRREKALDFRKLHEASPATLAEWIRPAGYFNVKTRRLKSFARALNDDFGGSLARLFRLETARLREVLLSVHGIGPETADSILLYAADRPVFVIDAYTRRFLVRHNWIDEKCDYDNMAALMQAEIPRDTALYNEFHALIVRLGKEHCRPRPICSTCPLRAWLPQGESECPV